MSSVKQKCFYSRSIVLLMKNVEIIRIYRVMFSSELFSYKYVSKSFFYKMFNKYMYNIQY